MKYIKIQVKNYNMIFKSAKHLANLVASLTKIVKIAHLVVSEIT